MKHVLITGGLQGIGRALVQHFQARGDCVSVFDCVQEDDERVKKLHEQGVIYYAVDIAQVDAIKHGFEKLYCYLDQNNYSLDILVNNAGITRDGLAIRTSEQDWDSVLDVNLKGAFFCTQQALKRMIKQQKSYIVNISSIVASTGNPGQSAYCASKAGMVALTKSLAAEYASRHVLVNAVAPGFIQTAMTEKLSASVQEKILAQIPLQRFGTVDDVARCVGFLTSGAADYITGQVIHVNGGLF